MLYNIKENRLVIKIKVIPNSGKNSIESVKNDELVIKVRTAPEKGKANRELVSYLSKLLKTAKSEIIIVSGTSSRHKCLSLPESLFGIFKKYLASD